MKNIRKTIAIALSILFITAPFYAFAYENEKTKGTDMIPKRYYAECPEQGTHQKLFNKAWNQCINVYFPYGYSNSKYSKYDVFMMLHQAGSGNLSSWIEAPCNSCGGAIPPKQIYDWLIYEKKIPQILVVCIDLDINENNRDDIRNAMHWVGNNLRTYAKNGTDEELSKAREHFFVGGLSMGAWKANKCMREDYDIFGNYIVGYGGGVNYAAHEIGKSYVKENNEKYFIKNLIVGCGNKDGSYKDTVKNYNILSTVSEKYHYFEYRGGHGWAAAIPMIYDALMFIYEGYEQSVYDVTSNVVLHMKTLLSGNSDVTK